MCQNFISLHSAFTTKNIGLHITETELEDAAATEFLISGPIMANL